MCRLAVAGDVNMDNNERLNTDANTAQPRYDLNANKWFVAGVLTPAAGCVTAPITGMAAICPCPACG